MKIPSASINTAYYFRALKHLMTHLHQVSEKAKETGMSSRNLAIVWAPNLLRTGPLMTNDQLHKVDNNNVENDKEKDETKVPTTKTTGHHTKLLFDLVQNTQVVQYLIDNAKWLFHEGTFYLFN